MADHSGTPGAGSAAAVSRGALLVLGAGGHGKVVADTARGAGWCEISFLDDALAPGTTVADWTVRGPLALAIERAQESAVVVALGDNARRLEWIERLERAGTAVPTLIATSAIVSARCTIGSGSVVVAGAVIAIDATIGRAAILNTACSVDHDCALGDGVHISPGARLGGGVSVGARSWIGIGASIRHGIRIGCDVVVGAGAAVVNDLPDGARVGGVPAKPLGD